MTAERIAELEAALAAKDAEKWQCAECGKHGVGIVEQADTFTWGAGEDAHELHYTAQIRTCPDCLAQYSGAENEDARMQAIYEFLAKERLVLKQRAEAAEIAYREEHRRAIEAERLMRGLVESARSLIGCSGRGAEYDDDGEKFTEEVQANVDQLHRRYCTRCRAAALLAEIEKKPVSPSEGR